MLNMCVRGLLLTPLAVMQLMRVCCLQVGFFEIVALPLFNGFVELIPGAKAMLDGVLANYDHWHSLQQV